MKYEKIIQHYPEQGHPVTNRMETLEIFNDSLVIQTPTHMRAQKNRKNILREWHFSMLGPFVEIAGDRYSQLFAHIVLQVVFPHVDEFVDINWEPTVVFGQVRS